MIDVSLVVIPSRLLVIAEDTKSLTSEPSTLVSYVTFVNVPYEAVNLMLSYDIYSYPRLLFNEPLKFSSVANVISKQDINSDNVKEWIFKINDEVVAEYDFTSAYEFDDDVDVFNLSLTAVAKQGSNNKFYIDSIASEKTITRIANETNVSLSGIENNLIIEHLNYNQEYFDNYFIQFLSLFLQSLFH